MAKCFISGVSIPLSNAYVLNTPASLRALKQINRSASDLQTLITSLGKEDRIRIHDHIFQQDIKRVNRRVVCSAVAFSIMESIKIKELFIKWPLWLERKSERRFWK